MLGPITSVTTVVSDLDAIAAAYTQHLGHSLDFSGPVPEDWARAWGAPQVAGRDMVSLMPEKGERVPLRFIRGPVPDGFGPHKTLGWNVTEISAGQIEAISERLKDSPFIEVGPPAPLSMNEYISAMQVVGPAGELVYLTETVPNDRTAHLPHVEEGVGRVFIMVMGVRDVSDVRAFYGDKLGATLTDPFVFSSSLITEPLGLPKGTELQMVLIRLPGKFTLEIDELGDAAATRPLPQGDLGPGIQFVGFAVRDLDAVANAVGSDWLGAPAVIDGKRVACLRGPNGEGLELVEDPDAFPA